MNELNIEESITNIMKYFAYAHLPKYLQAISATFAVLAECILDEIPNNEEKYQALRKLLEAKDCAVRAALN